MIQRNRLVAALTLGLLVLLHGVPEAAATQTVMHSASPFWNVGARNKKLSALCAIGRFNERSIGKYVVRLSGPNGPATLGVAKGTGLNLADPGHLAVRSEDYFFYQDGTSNCAVFVGSGSAGAAPTR